MFISHGDTVVNLFISVCRLPRELATGLRPVTAATAANVRVIRELQVATHMLDPAG